MAEWLAWRLGAGAQAAAQVVRHDHRTKCRGGAAASAPQGEEREVVCRAERVRRPPPEVIDELRQLNALDIELYGWVRNRTLVAFRRWQATALAR